MIICFIHRKYLQDILKKEGISGLVLTGMRIKKGKLTTADGTIVGDLSQVEGFVSTQSAEHKYVAIDETGVIKNKNDVFSGYFICQFVQK